ncbi:hypothetical protein ACIQ1J_00180 [Streptomyces sp. NPDC097107]
MPSVTTVVAHALHTAATVLRKDALQDGMVFGNSGNGFSPGIRG